MNKTTHPQCLGWLVGRWMGFSSFVWSLIWCVGYGIESFESAIQMANNGKHVELPLKRSAIFTQSLIPITHCHWLHFKNYTQEVASVSRGIWTEEEEEEEEEKEGEEKKATKPKWVHKSGEAGRRNSFIHSLEFPKFNWEILEGRLEALAWCAE